MTTPLPAGATGPADRFTLDPRAAAAFLSRIRRRWHGIPDPSAPAGETWIIGPKWEPREILDDDLFHLEALIPVAIEAGAVVAPDGWDLRLLTVTDPDGAWYQWQLGYCAAGDVPRTLGFAVTSESLDDLAIIGRDGARGTSGVLHVLLEAVECSNRLLDAYVEAAGRMRLPVMSTDTAAARASEIPD